MAVDPMFRSLSVVTDIGGGIFLGAISGARGHSSMSNLISSTAISFASSGLATALGSQRFFSKETLISALTVNAASTIMHALTRAEVDRRMTPQITFAAPSGEKPCPCKTKQWTDRVTDQSASPAVER